MAGHDMAKADDDFCELIADAARAGRLRKGLAALSISDELRLMQAGRYSAAADEALAKALPQWMGAE